MNINSKKCSGAIKISQDVIIDIAANVINEIDGIAVYNADKTIKFAGKPAVLVKFNNGAAEITVFLNAELGCNLQKCAETVQEKVKFGVQDMTSVMVSKVNVKFISII